MEPRLLDIPYPPRQIDESRRAWLEGRRAGIGGSDVGAILGLSRWKSALEVYWDKTGEVDVPDADNEYMLWGSINEAAIADEVSRRLGITLHRVNHQVAGDQPWKMANLDRRVVIPKPEADDPLPAWVPEELEEKWRAGELRVGIEIKTASEWTKRDWLEEGIPLVYLCQDQWYLHVTGWDLWLHATLFGGNDLQVWSIQPDAAALEAFLPKIEDFWRRIQEEDPPEPGPSEPDTLLLSKLYPIEESGKEVEWTEEVDHWRRLYAEAAEAVKTWEEQKREAQNRLRHLLGDGELIVCPDGKKITWKSNKDKVIESFDLEKFRVEHPKLAKKYTEEVVKKGPRVLRIAKPAKKKEEEK